MWLYGESAQWWLGGNQSRPTWEQKLPGATQALRDAADPLGAALERLKSIDLGENLLSNGGLQKVAAEGLPADWWEWQDERSNGTFSHQPSRAIANNVLDGVLGQTIEVQPGERYLVSTQLRSSGRGFVCLTIGWKSAEGNWIAKSPHQRFAANDVSAANEWGTAVGLVQVPEGIGKLVFMLTAVGQISNEDQAAFRDCLLVKQTDE